MTVSADSRITETANQLKSFCNRPFDIREKSTRFNIPVLVESPHRTIAEAQDYLNHEANVVSEKLLDCVFGGHPANPNRAEVVDRLNSIFEGESYYKNGKKLSYQDVKNAVLELIAGNQYSAIVGERGCGKTLLMNKILNDETHEFFEKEERLGWFRIDVTKIYDLYEDGRTDKSKIGFSNYFKVHASYVFLEYSGWIKNPHSGKRRQSDFFGEVLEVIFDADFKSSSSAATQQIEVIEEYYEALSEMTGSIVKFPSERAVGMLFYPENERYFNAMIGFFDSIATAFELREFGLVAIVDGVDNVSWSHHDDLYALVCRDAKQFIREFPDTVPTTRRSLVLVCRPETVPELDLELQTYNQGPEQIHKEKVRFNDWTMPLPQVISVLNKKLEAARRSEAFGAFRSSVVSELSLSENSPISGQRSLIKVLRSYRHGSNEIISQFVSEVNRIFSNCLRDDTAFFQTSINEDSFLSDVFSNNVRALIHSYRRSKEGRSIQAKQNIIGVNLPSRVPEFLLLGGKLYLDSSPRSVGLTRYAEIKMGDVFPNIFWFNPNAVAGYEGIWHGLSGLRLLQFVNRTPMVAADYLFVLHKIFGYSPEVLCEQLEAFVAFGLLDIDLQEPSREPSYCPSDGSFSRFETYRNFVKPAKKGKILATLAFFYVDYLYFCALDSPMHSWFLKDHSGESFVRFYIDAFFEGDQSEAYRARRYDFNQARIPTTAVFLRHILNYHAEEMEFSSIESTKGLKDGEIYDMARRIFSVTDSQEPVNALRSLFCLPNGWFDNAMERLEGGLRSTNRKEPSPFEELELLVKGKFALET